MSDRLEPMLPETAVLNYFGREEAASPAVGSKRINDQEEAGDHLPRIGPPGPGARQARRRSRRESKLEKVAQGSGVGGD